jgi:CRP-like cAMP-binding protein
MCINVRPAHPAIPKCPAIPRGQQKPGMRMTKLMAASSFAASCASAVGQPGGFLSHLGAADLRQLMALGERVPYATQEVLFAQGLPAGKCFSVVEGVVCLYRTEGDNRRQITGFALPGDILEIATQAHHEVSAAAVGSALVWEIPREKFTQFASHRPYVLNEIVALMAAEVADAHDKMFSLGRRAAEEKVIVFLMSWRDRLARLGRDVDPLPVPMSRRDIADHLGLTVETVCRTLAKLERRGAIEILAGRIRLLDAESVTTAAIA